MSVHNVEIGVGTRFPNGLEIPHVDQYEKRRYNNYPACQALSRAGIAIDEVVKDVIKDDLGHHNSAFRSRLIGEILEQSENIENEKVRAVRLPYDLSADDQANLRSLFPQYALSFGRMSHGHAFSACMNILDREYFLDLVKYRTVKIIYGYDVFFKDVGGKIHQNYREALYNCHSCEPILTQQDFFRAHEREEALISDEGFNAYLTYNHPQVLCNGRAQDCNITARYVFFRQSMYDMTFEDVGLIMTRANCAVAYATAIIPTDALVNVEGKIDQLNLKWRLDKDGDELVLSYAFRDGANGYRHNYERLMSWLFTKSFSTVHGNFLIDIVAQRGHTRVIKILRVNDCYYHSIKTVMTEVRVFNINLYGDGNVCVTVMMYNSAYYSSAFVLPDGNYDRCNQLRRVSVIVPRKTWEKLVTQASTMREGNFVFSSLMTFAAAVNNQRLVTGGAFSIDSRMPACDLIVATVAAYNFSYCERYRATRTISVFTELEKRVREYRESSIVTRFLMSLKDCLLDDGIPHRQKAYDDLLHSGVEQKPELYDEIMGEFAMGFKPVVLDNDQLFTHEGVLSGDFVNRQVPIAFVHANKKLPDPAKINRIARRVFAKINKIKEEVDDDEDLSTASVVTHDVTKETDTINAVKYICRKNLIVEEVPGDGNCGYECLRRLFEPSMTLTQFKTHLCHLFPHLAGHINDCWCDGTVFEGMVEKYSASICMHVQEGQYVVGNGVCVGHVRFTGPSDSGHFDLLRERVLITLDNCDGYDRAYGFTQYLAVREKAFADKKIPVKPKLPGGVKDRAHAKMKEILQMVTINIESTVILDLGAAPGGMSFAFASAKKYIAVSRSSLVDSASLEFYNDLLSNVEVIYDDLLNPELSRYCSDSVNIVIADAAIDPGGDYDSQESSNFALIAAEWKIAKLHMVEGSTMILKLFGVNNSETRQLMTEVERMFRNVYYVKPPSSNPINMEFYVVAVGFCDLTDRQVTSMQFEKLQRVMSTKCVRAFDISANTGWFRGVITNLFGGSTLGSVLTYTRDSETAIRTFTTPTRSIYSYFLVGGSTICARLSRLGSTFDRDGSSYLIRGAVTFLAPVIVLALIEYDVCSRVNTMISACFRGVSSFFKKMKSYSYLFYRRSLMSMHGHGAVSYNPVRQKTWRLPAPIVIVQDQPRQSEFRMEDLVGTRIDTVVRIGDSCTSGEDNCTVSVATSESGSVVDVGVEDSVPFQGQIKFRPRSLHSRDVKRVAKVRSGSKKLNAINAFYELLETLRVKIELMTVEAKNYADEWTLQMIEYTKNNASAEQIRHCEATSNGFHYVNEKFENVLTGRVEQKCMVAYDGVTLIDIENVVAWPVVVHANYEIMPDLKIYDRLKKLRPEKLIANKSLRIDVVQGVAGCGKTTDILSRYDPLKDIILTAGREGKDDVMEKVVAKFPHLTKKNFRIYTIDSYIINVIKDGFVDSADFVYVDEYLMKHSGFIVAIRLLVDSTSIMCFGDKFQIPYIERVQQIAHHIKFKTPETFANEVAYRTTTYRCPQDVAKMMTGIYGVEVNTTSEVVYSCALHRYVADEFIDFRDFTILTFLQNDKAELETYLRRRGFTNKVLTVGMAQGKTVPNVIMLRRLTTRQSVLYSDMQQILVAITRHTKKFEYYTPDENDTISQLVKRHSVVGGGMLMSLREAEQNSIVPALERQDFHPEMVDLGLRYGTVMGTNHRVPVKRYDPSYFDRENSSVVADVALCQGIYDECVNGVSAYDRTYDSQLNAESDLHLGGFSGLIVEHANPFQVKDEAYLTPRLRTNIMPLRPRCQPEELVALTKRNLDVPDLEDLNFTTTTLKMLVDSFFDAYVDVERYQQVKELTTTFSPMTMSEWLIGQGEDILKKMDVDVVVDSMRLHNYEFSIKPQTKPSMDPADVFTYPALQTIAAHPKHVNAVFCSTMRVVKERLLHVLKPNVILAMDLSPIEVAKRMMENVGDHHPPYIELDISKYDKSQGELALRFDLAMMRKFGVHEEIVQLWYFCHTNTVLTSYDSKFKAFIHHQRKSGDATTLLGNTWFNMAVCAVTFKYQNFVVSLFQGDDSLIIGNDLQYRNTIEFCGRVFNLSVKIYSFNYAYFCSKFLIRVADQWVFIPDPLKMLTKLGRHDVRNYEHLEEYRTALMDLFSCYDNVAIHHELSIALAERYGFDLDLTAFIGSLIGLIRDRERFFGLFYVRPGVTLLKDRNFVPLT